MCDCKVQLLHQPLSFVVWSVISPVVSQPLKNPQCDRVVALKGPCTQLEDNRDLSIQAHWLIGIFGLDELLDEVVEGRELNSAVFRSPNANILDYSPQNRNRRNDDAESGAVIGQPFPEAREHRPNATELSHPVL